LSTALAAAARVDEPLARVLAFSRRFGPETTALAMHAALPLGLSPELVHLLRVNFVPRAPFIAEADLLLSPLCTEAGGGMYEMDGDVRELLLAEMARTPRYGPARQRHVAGFLRLWAERVLDDTADPELQEHLRVQQWVALAYADPARAAEALAGALRAGVERADRPEVARVARLTTVLSAPLAAEVALRRYAGAVERMAATGGASVPSGAGPVSIGRERLPSMDRVVRLWNPAPAPDIQQQANVSDGEPIQQQANVADQPFQQGSGDTAESTRELQGYRVARVLVLGDSGAGKSSLLARISRDVWEQSHATHGAMSARWEAESSETGAQDVVLHEADLSAGPLAMRMVESDAVLVVVAAGSAEMDGAARRWLSAAAATGVSRPTLLVVTRSDTAEFIPSSLAAVVREFNIGGPYLSSARMDQGIAELRAQIRHIIPWDRVSRAASRDEVDWLHQRMEARFQSSPVADYHEATRHEIIASFLLTAADAEAALGRAMQCLVARDVVRIIGEPPSAIVRSEDYARCLGEVWRFVGEARHDVPGLPAAPLNALEEHFATAGLVEYLDADTSGVLGFVIEDLAHRRWAYEVYTRRGQLVVIPALYRQHETLTGITEPGGHPLIRARWPGHVDDVFALLLVHLADYGTFDLRPQRSALFAVGTELFQLHASAEEGTAQVTLSSLRAGEGGGELVELVRDRVGVYLPEGVRAEFSYPEITSPSPSALEPPAGVDLARACLVVLPLGTRQVGERVIDFDAVWEHLFRPAIEDMRLPEGEPLVPVRVSELPPPGSPLPDWMKAARIVLVDLTGADPMRIRELGLIPGFRTQTVVFVSEEGPVLEADFDGHPVYDYVFGSPELLARQRREVAALLADSLRVPDGGTGAGGEMLVTTAVQLNVRQGPGRDQPVVAQLQKGTRVERLEEADGWMRIQALDGVTGWISAQFAAPESAAATPGEAPVPGRVRVTASVLNLRAGPGTDQPATSQVAVGTVLDRLEESAGGGWLRVRSPDGREGWVSSRYVTDLSPQPVLTAAVAPTVLRPGEDVKVGVVFFTEEARGDASQYLDSRPWAQQTVQGPALGGHESGVTIHARMTMPWLSNTGLFNRMPWDGKLVAMQFAVRVPADTYQTRGSLRLDFGVSLAPDDTVVYAEAMAFEVEVVAEDSARTPEPPPTAYASFARDDRDDVLERIASLRSASGPDVFVGPASLQGAGEWTPFIDGEICSRDVFLLFWSRAAAASQWVEREWGRALECFRSSGEPEIQIHLLEEGAVELLPPELREFAVTSSPVPPNVFIGSTLWELEGMTMTVDDACAAAGTTALRAEPFLVETFGGTDSALEMVDRADVYLGVFAYHYGLIPESSDISIAEIEYNRAVERGVPRLIFLLEEHVPVPLGERETATRAERLHKLKSRLMKEQTVSFFSTPEELHALIVEGLRTVRRQMDEARSQGVPRPGMADDRPRRKGEAST
jgi:SH3-like domain-containing protein